MRVCNGLAPLWPAALFHIAGGDTMATEKPRYSITLDEEMFKEVEDFRFEHRYQTRNQATIELIRLGLAEIKRQQQAHKES
jgi:metal-responsive CopG/Arc/MetJ family transcriptional regulator